MQILADWLKNTQQTPANPAQVKRTLRSALRKEREQLKASVPTLEWGELQIKNLNSQLPIFGNSSVEIAAYFPIHCELNLTENCKPTWLFPASGNDGTLNWFRLGKATDLSVGSFGIPERETRHTFSLENVHKPILMLVPALAVAKSGIRLGYGKGFYDKVLTEWAHKIVSIVAIHSGLYFDELPAENHDKAVDVIVTENEIHFLTDRDLLLKKLKS